MGWNEVHEVHGTQRAVGMGWNGCENTRRFTWHCRQLYGALSKDALVVSLLFVRLQSFLAIGKEEGVLGYWKGNLPQVWSNARTERTGAMEEDLCFFFSFSVNA